MTDDRGQMTDCAPPRHLALSRKPQDLGDKAGRASLFRLQEENQGIKLWG
jgi:hypothetical protein